MDEAKIRELVELACVSEVMARKPGNVYPGAPFEDLTADDLIQAGRAIAPVMAGAPGRSVGQTILESVQAAQAAAQTNANLGIILLFAPICTAMGNGDLRPASVWEVLEGLTIEDAELTYEAIRQAAPGGLGEVDDQDVAEPPTVTLLEAMQSAAGWDGIARQYAVGMKDVFLFGPPIVLESLRAGRSPEEAIVWSHLRWMGEFPDTLIARKCGGEIAIESSRRARRVMGASTERVGEHGPIPKPHYLDSPPIAKFDAWLRAEGNTRNPGTSADLVAASLLVLHATVLSAS